MGVSTRLFELIKSLTKGEKRYFKINTETEANYLKLFDTVDKQKTYNEDKIKMKFKGEIFTKQLHVTKNYLYNLILKQLRDYQEPHAIQAKIKNLLLESDILQQKGLYKQSETLLKRAKTIAVKYNNNIAVIEVLNRQITNAVNFNPKGNEAVVEQLYDEVGQTMTTLRTEQTLSQLNHQLFITLLKRRKEREANFLDILEQRMTHPILKNADTLTTFNAQYLFHNIKGIYFRLTGDLKASKVHQQKVVQIWETNPHKIKELPQLYRLYLANYLNICHANKSYVEFPNLLQKLEQLPTRTFDEAAETFQDLMQLQILYYMNTAQFEESIKIIPQIRTGIKKYKEKINIARQLTLNINIAIMFFAAAEYDEALFWVTNILNQARSDHRQDIQRFARILQLVLHLELGNDRMYDDLYDSVYRNLRYKIKPNKFEKLALENIKNIYYATSRRMRREAYETFEEQLISLTDEQNRRKELGIEELELWVKSKLEQRSFSEVLKEIIVGGN